MENSREDANAETGIFRDGGEIYGTPPSVLSFFFSIFAKCIAYMTSEFP